MIMIDGSLLFEEPNGPKTPGNIQIRGRSYTFFSYVMTTQYQDFRTKYEI